MNYINCIRLEELLEHYSVMYVFASGNANAARFEFAPNAGMTEDTVDYASAMWCNGCRKKGWNESGGKI